MIETHLTVDAAFDHAFRVAKCVKPFALGQRPQLDRHSHRDLFIIRSHKVDTPAEALVAVQRPRFKLGVPVIT